MRYLLDTKICIYALTGSRPVLNRMAHSVAGDLGISSITYAELRAGAERTGAARERDLALIARLIELVPVLPFDESAAEVFGAIRQTAFRPRTSFDQLIAAQALSRNLILVTNNGRDFANVNGLRIENWTRDND